MLRSIYFRCIDRRFNSFQEITICPNGFFFLQFFFRWRIFITIKISYYHIWLVMFYKWFYSNYFEAHFVKYFS